MEVNNNMREQIILIIAVLAYTLSIVGAAAADDPGTTDNSSTMITDNSSTTDPTNGGTQSVTTTGDAIDPTTGDLIDPTTGDLIDPTTGDLIDPTTGDLIDPTTGDLIDPTTGDLIDPTTGDLIDPTTGDLIDPTTGDLIDPTTGDLIDPTTGDLIDPTTGDLIDPTTGDSGSNSTVPIVTPIISNPIFGNGGSGILPIYVLANTEGYNGLSTSQQNTDPAGLTYTSIGIIDASNSGNNQTTDPTTQNNTSTIPMQNTGGPLIPLALSTLMMVGGLVTVKIRNYQI